MKSSRFVFLTLLAPLAAAQAQTAAAPGAAPSPQPAPRVYSQSAPAARGPVYVYDQKPVASRPAYLIAPEQAQSIIDRFKDHYRELQSPRVLIYVNRELIDESVGLKLSSHKRVVESARPGSKDVAGAASEAAGALTERVTSTNIYRVKEPQPLSLADKQTLRDVERLFGRPLRMAGVQLADQRVATLLIGSAALDGYKVDPDSAQARKEREALTKVADVVLEILISSKEVTVSDLSGESTYQVPDIHATAIRLSDARILGQATAADLIGFGPGAGVAMRSFGVREIAEATALSLMEDMMLR